MLADGRFYLGHLGKTPVYVAPEAAFNLVLIWMWCDKTIPGFLSVLMAFVIVILAHESGHAVLARAMGMHGISITLSAFGGYCSYGGNRQPKRELPIILAGCAFNLLTALLLWAVNQYVYPVDRIDPLMRSFYWAVFAFSLVLGVFNLLPIYPLDGGQALLAISRMVSRTDSNARRFTLSVTVASAICLLPLVWYFGMFFTVFILVMLLFSAFRDLR